MSEQIDPKIQGFKIKAIKQEHKYRRFPKQCKDYMEESENSQCPYCEMNYKDKYIMHTHLYRVHQKYPYRCTGCLKTFPKIRLLKLHIEQEHLKTKKKENKIKKSQNISNGINSSDDIYNSINLKSQNINNNNNNSNSQNSNINLSVNMARSRDINQQQMSNYCQQQNVNQKQIENSQLLLSKNSQQNNNNNNNNYLKMTTSKYTMGESIMDDLLPICEQVSEEADIHASELNDDQNVQQQQSQQQKIYQGNQDTNPLINQIASDSNKVSILLNNNNNQNCQKNNNEQNRMSQSKLMERSTLSLQYNNNQDNLEDSQMRRSRSKMTRSQLLFKLARQKQGYNENNKYQELYKQESKEMDFKRFEPSKQLYRKKKQSTIFDDLNNMTKSLNSDDRLRMDSSFDSKYWQPKKKVMTENMVSIPCMLK